MGKRFDEIRFVTAEDNDTYNKQRKFYEQLNKVPEVKIDVREYKFKTVQCKCQLNIKMKVQAEVDVAISVYLINYALN